MVTNTVDTVTSILTQQELDHFCNTYNILAELGLELPGRDDTIKDAPAGKIGIYTRFLEFANFRASILKDPLPSDNRVNAELLALLDHHRTIIKRYLETFLCLVGLSRSFDDVHVRPTFLKDNDSDTGLLDFVKSADPFKVKTKERNLAQGEIPLNNETVNMIVPLMMHLPFWHEGLPFKLE
ncbi:hypothetical protein Tco_0369681 [Tanacetum coccineum]